MTEGILELLIRLPGRIILLLSNFLAPNLFKEMDGNTIREIFLGLLFWGLVILIIAIVNNT